MYSKQANTFLLNSSFSRVEICRPKICSCQYRLQTQDYSTDCIATCMYCNRAVFCINTRGNTALITVNSWTHNPHIKLGK